MLKFANDGEFLFFFLKLEYGIMDSCPSYVSTA